jgi:hypothetical protein
MIKGFSKMSKEHPSVKMISQRMNFIAVRINLRICKANSEMNLMNQEVILIVQFKEVNHLQDRKVKQILEIVEKIRHKCFKIILIKDLWMGVNNLLMLQMDSKISLVLSEEVISFIISYQYRGPK